MQSQPAEIPAVWRCGRCGGETWGGLALRRDGRRCKGLASWDQEPDRIARLRANTDFAVYTPGSNAGQPVSVLRNFAPPSADIMAEKDLLRDRIQSTVTALLALLGIPLPEDYAIDGIDITPALRGKLGCRAV